MCLSDLSGCELVSLASAVAIFISNNLSTDELNIVSTFITSIGDNLATLATARPDEDCN